jgi:ribosomal-protein-alanine N-acetyltransferase
MRTTWKDDTLCFSYATVEDIDEYATMLAKDTVCEHVVFGPNSREETLGFFEPLIVPMQESIKSGERPGNHVFTLRAAADNRFVGQCASMTSAFARDHYQIGYQLDDGWWRAGLGTRVCEFLLHFGFGLLGADRLSAECLASNAGSIRILETCGFTLEGRQRRQFFSRGRHHDQLLFGLLREDVAVDLAALAERYR